MAEGAGASGGYEYAYQKNQFTSKDIAGLDKEQRDLIIRNYEENLKADAKAQGREGKAPTPNGPNMFVSLGKVFKGKGKKKADTQNTASNGEENEEVTKIVEEASESGKDTKVAP